MNEDDKGTVKTKAPAAPTGDNQFQAVNRYKKARLIADTLRALGVTDVTPEPTQEQLEIWGGMAKAKATPSLVTWAVVRAMLTEDAWTKSLLEAAVDAADLALRLGSHHPDYQLAKVDMNQKLALLTPEELSEFAELLDERQETHSFRGDSSPDATAP